MSRSIETGTDHLHARVEDKVCIITLNRPERRNALSNEMIRGFEGALVDAETATDVGAVVVTGAGGAFCAGGDVKGMAEASSGGGRGGGEGLGLDSRIHRQRLAQRGTSGRLYAMPKPTIASLPGAAAGASGTRFGP